MVHHGAGLRRLTGKDSLVDNLSELNLKSDQLEAPDRILLQFALKLTREPASISREDIEPLRKQGFDDRAIHDLCQTVAYFNYVNRIADGLGVELEKRFATAET